MRVALVSLNHAWENKDLNFQACRTFIEKAKTQDVELVIFPEMTLTAFSMNTEETAEDRATSNTATLFQKLAAEFQIAIVFGVVFRDGDKATNNALMIDSAGVIKGCYSKIHPFSFAGEDKVFNGGSEIIHAELGPMVIGLTICYDLRFPEIYSALAKHCDLIINIANWPAKRIDHWNALLKARAIENQLFMVGVNRTGVDGNGFSYVKSSMVVTPDGVMIEPVESWNEMDIFDIDLGDVSRYRTNFPTVRDKRYALYSAFFGNY